MTEFVETVGLRCPARLMFEVTTIKKYMTDMYDVPLAAATVSDTAVYCSVFARCPLGAEGPRWSSGRGRQVQFPGVATGKSQRCDQRGRNGCENTKKGEKTQKSRHIELQRSSNAFDTSTEMWLAYLPDPSSSF